MDRTRKIRASIIGITGFTGLETLRLLTGHPSVEIVHLASRQHDNVMIGEIYPHLSHLDLRVRNIPATQIAQDSDVVFLALPHKSAQTIGPDLIGKTKIIDLSADFRLTDQAVYEDTYKIKHQCPELISQFVYGVPEFFKSDIQNAKNVANPGCFALLTQLMLFPFRHQMAHAHIMAVTGSSGSGKTLSDSTHHPVRAHNMQSYSINSHRHIPEILATSGLNRDQISFVPTSGPFVRGIFATAFITLKDQTVIDNSNIYAHAPFIRVQQHVTLANIIGSNFCDLSFTKEAGNNVIVQGALDNIVKGSGGNAIECMNLMFGLHQSSGLENFQPLYL